jgi:hypothetical protein
MLCSAGYVPVGGKTDGRLKARTHEEERPYVYAQVIMRQAFTSLVGEHGVQLSGVICLMFVIAIGASALIVNIVSGCRSRLQNSQRLRL